MAVYSSEFEYGQNVTYIDDQGNRQNAYFMNGTRDPQISVVCRITKAGGEWVVYTDTADIEGA